jgi:hypothetical protein
MFSFLRKGLLYKDISPDILEHDEDLDADQWTYEDKDVYRGSFDPRYTKDNLNVYWLYDDNLNRVGLAEHEADDETYFAQLDAIEPLEKLIQKYQPEIPVLDQYFLKEFILWALVEYKKLSKERTEDGFQFKDPYSRFISKLS